MTQVRTHGDLPMLTDTGIQAQSVSELLHFCCALAKVAFRRHLGQSGRELE